MQNLAIMTLHTDADLEERKMTGKQTGNDTDSTERLEMEEMDLANVGASTIDGTEKEEPPHCPAELVKATLRMRGLRVNIAGPLGERINNDLMMEGWHGRRPKDKK